MNKKILEGLKKLQVWQLQNKNQYVINYQNEDNENLLCFQSYKTLIAIYNQTKRELYINWQMWDYSKTTMKHLKMFVNEYTPFTYENKKQFSLELLGGEIEKF